VDLEILPEPTEDERQAIVQALLVEAEEQHDLTPWRRAALESDGDRYATAPRRHSRGATRA
jgi:hypothetical protein